MVSESSRFSLVEGKSDQPVRNATTLCQTEAESTAPKTHLNWKLARITCGLSVVIILVTGLHTAGVKLDEVGRGYFHECHHSQD